MRKIVQLAALPDHVFALCDDGTLWLKQAISTVKETDWYRVTGIPGGDRMVSLTEAEIDRIVRALAVSWEVPETLGNGILEKLGRSPPS